jgi:hypothetical protein
MPCPILFWRKEVFEKIRSYKANKQHITATHKLTWILFINSLNKKRGYRFYCATNWGKFPQELSTYCLNIRARDTTAKTKANP